MDISEMLGAIAGLQNRAATIAKALDAHIKAEPPARAGELHRLRQILIDLSHSIRQTRQPVVDKLARIKSVITRAA